MLIRKNPQIVILTLVGKSECRAVWPLQMNDTLEINFDLTSPDPDQLALSNTYVNECPTVVDFLCEKLYCNPTTSEDGHWGSMIDTP